MITTKKMANVTNPGCIGCAEQDQNKATKCCQNRATYHDYFQSKLMIRGRLYQANLIRADLHKINVRKIHQKRFHLPRLSTFKCVSFNLKGKEES